MLIVSEEYCQATNSLLQSERILSEGNSIALCRRVFTIEDKYLAIYMIVTSVVGRQGAVA